MIILVAGVIGLGAFLNFKSPGMSKGRIAAVSAQPLPTPEYAANKPAKEYIHVNGKLLALSEPVNSPPTDLAVWRLSAGSGTSWGRYQAGWDSTHTLASAGELPAP